MYSRAAAWMRAPASETPPLAISNLISVGSAPKQPCSVPLGKEAKKAKRQSCQKVARFARAHFAQGQDLDLKVRPIASKMPSKRAERPTSMRVSVCGKYCSNMPGLVDAPSSQKSSSCASTATPAAPAPRSRSGRAPRAATRATPAASTRSSGWNSGWSSNPPKVNVCRKPGVMAPMLSKPTAPTRSAQSTDVPAKSCRPQSLARDCSGMSVPATMPKITPAATEAARRRQQRPTAAAEAESGRPARGAERPRSTPNRPEPKQASMGAARRTSRGTGLPTKRPPRVWSLGTTRPSPTEKRATAKADASNGV
mmetsp:Transcript_91413/g.295725  ORF Transcript_91413/g.295725 Transcript_91413/m.295725 type:complete len:311 (+) Transcript_91413:668-1600(+)